MQLHIARIAEVEYIVHAYADGRALLERADKTLNLLHLIGIAGILGEDNAVGDIYLCIVKAELRRLIAAFAQELRRGEVGKADVDMSVLRARVIADALKGDVLRAQLVHIHGRGVGQADTVADVFKGQTVLRGVGKSRRAEGEQQRKGERECEGEFQLLFHRVPPDDINITFPAFRGQLSASFLHVQYT